MEIADSPKMDLIGLKENMTTAAAQRISVVDHINGFQYAPERSDNFVIDMEESYSSNPRITLQRSFSRKGSFRGGGYGGSEKKVNSNSNLNSNSSAPKEKESAAAAATSPAAGALVGEGGLVVGSSTPENGVVEGQGHHQITITSSAGSIKATAAVDRPSTVRRNSFKRNQTSWLLDPRKVLFFFATLSCIGTLLLIFFTLSISEIQSDEVE